MSFKYYPLSLSPPTSASSILIDTFQSLLNEQFSIATDVFDIEEEYVFASGSYINTKVRIVSAINSATGQKLPDDYKTILFKDIDHSIMVGKLFYFDQNYWLATNVEKIKNLTASCTVRRCNNVLRWIDVNGNLNQEYCVLDYDFGGYDDNIKKDTPVTPGKTLSLYCQLNSKTNKIYSGQRFIFGSPNGEWSAFYILGNAVRNFLNQKTTDNTSGQILYLELGSHAVNPDSDDLVLGIADKYKNSYLLSVFPISTSGSIGGSVQIYPTITLNGDPVTKPISYLSSASPIATVSNSGLIDFISTGG